MRGAGNKAFGNHPQSLWNLSFPVARIPHPASLFQIDASAAGIDLDWDAGQFVNFAPWLRS
jgi:hypothetical protein